MSYVDGFVIPVPKGKKQAYQELAAKAAPVFKEYGATQIVECWGDDVPAGQVTDFQGAVKAEPNEQVVFSWIVYRSKTDRNRINAKVMKDPRIVRMMEKDMPMDMKRFSFGGFKTMVAL